METIRHEEYMRRKAQEEKADMVNHPPHYNRHGIEAIDAIQAATGDGFEYPPARHGPEVPLAIPYKGKPLEDLKKARWYLDRLIEEHDPEPR